MSDVSAWHRWEMSSISAATTAAPARAMTDRSALPAGRHPVLMVDEAELLRLRQQSEQAGHAEGYRAGFEQGKAEGCADGLGLVQEQAQALRNLMLALPAAMRAAESEVADDLMALALEIARQMVGQALASEPQHLLSLVRELLRMEPTLSGTPRLLLHVDDAALVQQHMADELHAAGWRVRTDPGIARGGCRVHAAGGALDATLETRWERIEATFMRKKGSDEGAGPAT